MKTPARFFLRPALLLLLLLGFAGAAAALDVRYAGYGLGKEGIEVTDLVRRQLARGQNRILVSNQTFGTDPSPGKRKYFYVEYFINGEYRKQQAPEGATFVFPAEERRGGSPADRRGDGERDRRGEGRDDRRGGDGGRDRGGWDGERDRGGWDGERDRGGRGDEGGRRGGDGAYEGRPGSQLRFVNGFGDAVRIYSLSEFGRWEWVANLPPGARISTPARRGQFFVVTDGANQELRRVRANEGSQTVLVQ